MDLKELASGSQASPALRQYPEPPVKMSCWAVIPSKAPEFAKSRLANHLDPAARISLMERMLHQVIDAARCTDSIEKVLIVGHPPSGLSKGVEICRDPGGGLNLAVQSVLATLGKADVERAIFVLGDLPLVTSEDLERLARAPHGTICIAPDRHGRGTNAISLPLPVARDFTFAFGPDSFRLHSEETERLDLSVQVVRSIGLAHDIDEPADLPDGLGLI